MARAVRLFLALALALPAVALTASSCAACECAFIPVPQQLQDADAAIMGEVVSQRGAQGGTIQVFRVDGVFAGEVGPRIELFARIGQGIVDSCAVLLPTDARVAVIADRNADGTYSASACSLVTEAELRKAAGPPLPPDPSIVSTPTQAPTPAVGAQPPKRELPAWLVILLGASLGTGLIAGTMAVPRWRAVRRASSAQREPGGTDEERENAVPEA